MNRLVTQSTIQCSTLKAETPDGTRKFSPESNKDASARTVEPIDRFNDSGAAVVAYETAEWLLSSTTIWPISSTLVGWRS